MFALPHTYTITAVINGEPFPINAGSRVAPALADLQRANTEGRRSQQVRQLAAPDWLERETDYAAGQGRSCSGRVHGQTKDERSICTNGRELKQRLPDSRTETPSRLTRLATGDCDQRLRRRIKGSAGWTALGRAPEEEAGGGLFWIKSTGCRTKAGAIDISSAGKAARRNLFPAVRQAELAAGKTNTQ